MTTRWLPLVRGTAVSEFSGTPPCYTIPNVCSSPESVRADCVPNLTAEPLPSSDKMVRCAVTVLKRSESTGY